MRIARQGETRKTHSSPPGAAASCLGGDRTPAGARFPSHNQTSRNCRELPCFGHSFMSKARVPSGHAPTLAAPTHRPSRLETLASHRSGFEPGGNRCQLFRRDPGADGDGPTPGRASARVRGGARTVADRRGPWQTSWESHGVDRPEARPRGHVVHRLAQVQRPSELLLLLLAGALEIVKL